MTATLDRYLILVVFGVIFLLLVAPAVWDWSGEWANEIALEEYGKPLESLGFSERYLVGESGPVILRGLVLTIGLGSIVLGAMLWRSKK